MAKSYPVPNKEDVDALVAFVIEHAKVVQSEGGRHYVTVQLDGKVPSTFRNPKTGIEGRLNFAWFGLQDTKQMATARLERTESAIESMGEADARALLAKLQAKLANKPTK